MSDTTASNWRATPIVETEERAARPPKANWPLMGDILMVRGGIPEHLIQWRRATGEDDPESRL